MMEPSTLCSTIPLAARCEAKKVTGYGNARIIDKHRQWPMLSFNRVEQLVYLFRAAHVTDECCCTFTQSLSGLVDPFGIDITEYESEAVFCQCFCAGITDTLCRAGHQRQWFIRHSRASITELIDIRMIVPDKRLSHRIAVAG